MLESVAFSLTSQALTDWATEDIQYYWPKLYIITRPEAYASMIFSPKF